MAVVPSEIKFALRTCRPRMDTEVHSWSCLRLIFSCALYLPRLFAKKDFYKKQSLAYQKRHGCRRFQAAASFSSEKLVVGQRTRTYAVQHACGCFLYAPSIYSVYLQKRLLQRANSKSASPISKKNFYKKQSSTYQKRHGCRRFQTAQLFYKQSTIYKTRKKIFRIFFYIACPFGLG